MPLLILNLCFFYIYSVWICTFYTRSERVRFSAAVYVLTLYVMNLKVIFNIELHLKLCTHSRYRLCPHVIFMLCAGLCPDWETWDPVKPVENATEAMQLADEWLGIPQVRFPLTSYISFKLTFLDLMQLVDVHCHEWKT